MAETNDPSPGRDPFNDRRKLARALREARDSAGLTQSELGGKVGRHPSVISRLEKAEYDMPPELASNLAEVLAAKSPLGLRLAKESLNRVEDLGLKDGYRLEQDYTGRMTRYHDSAEARLAYLEKRDPQWTWT